MAPPDKLIKMLKNNCFVKFILIVYILFSSSFSPYSQNNYLVGYKKATGGTYFTYHSPFSNSEGSLLVRARKGYAPIEWETEPIPLSYQEKSVSFSWLYGIDVLPKSQSFEMYINDEKLFIFSNPVGNETKVWSVEGKDGASLVFNQSLIDKHKDQMGYAILTLPTKSMQLGKPVRIKVAGIDNQSEAWYMTFKVSLEEKITTTQLNTVTRKEGQLFHSIRFNIIHLNTPAKVAITINEVQQTFELNTGLNEIDFLVPIISETTLFNARVEIEEKPSQYFNIKLEPVKEWTIYLVQHAHTDIGYTRPQSEILAEHLRYIDYALDYCDQTDSYPDNAKFRWTCEAAWTIREYLKCRPQVQIDRLVKRIKEGRIEVTAMFFNYSEIVDETGLAIQTQTLGSFKENGIEVTTAMQNDINGIGWCMVDMFKNTGVKYLIMGEHGHRAQIPFDKPTAFWWESQAGNRLLAYRSEHYMHGNVLGITSGNIDVFRDNLSAYLDKLEGKNYPFDHTAFQFSGYITDNSPPSTTACDIIKQWNEKYEWPKLKLSVASEFMEYVENNYSDQIETQKVAWPDWWSDGCGSAMNETKISRTIHADMIANTGLISMAEMAGATISSGLDNDITQCYDNLLFYDEHTYGADESISNPDSENSINQWEQKSSFVWSASLQSGLLTEKAMGLIQPFIETCELPSIAVFNTLNWSRTGVVKVFIDHELLPPDKEFLIIGADGKPIPAQLLSSRSEGSYWALWVSNIPPMGYSTYKIHVQNELVISDVSTKNTISNTFENEFYKLTFDLYKGGVSGIIDKEMEKELIDKNSEISLGNFIYEELESRHAMERLTNEHRDTAYVPLKKEISSISDLRMIKIEEGKIWKSIFLNGKIPGCSDDEGVNIEIRLFNQTKKIELLYEMQKLPKTTPEGIYISFPFGMTNKDQLSFDVQGGIVYPGVNQLEGTSSDWNTIQNFAAVKNENAQIVFSSNDIPLVQFGEINTGRFYYKHVPEKTHIYSWVLNNYWTTNFKASQHGELKWNYFITSSSDNSNSFATRFGMENKVPMLARVIPKGVITKNPVSKSLIDLNSVSNLILVELQPEYGETGFTLHFREVDGIQVSLDINSLLQKSGVDSVYEVNVLGEKVAQINKPVLFQPFESKFILVKLRN